MVGGLGNSLAGDTGLFLGLGSGNGLGFLAPEEDDDEDLVGDDVERGRFRLGLSESDEDTSLGDRLRTGEALRELERDLGLGRGLGGGDFTLSSGVWSIMSSNIPIKLLINTGFLT